MITFSKDTLELLKDGSVAKAIGDLVDQRLDLIIVTLQDGRKVIVRRVG